MSDKRNHRNPKKAFYTWVAALRHAEIYAYQTRYKFKVRRVGSVYRIQRTATRITATKLGVR